MQPTKYKMGYLCVYGCMCLPVCVNGKGVGKSWFHSSFCIKCFLGGNEFSFESGVYHSYSQN